MGRKQGHYRAHTPDHGLTCQYLYDTLGVEIVWEAEDHYQKMRNRDSFTNMTLFLNTILMRNKGDKGMQTCKPETRSHSAE